MDFTEFISRILLIWNSTTMATVFEAFAAIVVLLRFCFVQLQGVRLYDYRV